MARAIERIEQDISGLKQAMSEIAITLEHAYTDYLSLLGAALRKQLILASYHLCTQGYPEHFLKLSLNQRQQLQQEIRQLGAKTSLKLVTYIKDREVEAAETTESRPADPIELLQWQQSLEEFVQETLKECSQNTNVLIQKTGILAKKLPESILVAAIAAASEASGEVIPSPPNLLNLVIQVSHEQDSEDPQLAQIMIINLRLGEIEFAETPLLSGRKQIRNILLQLNTLGRDYQKKQKELKVAEAEVAWRAAWFE